MLKYSFRIKIGPYLQSKVYVIDWYFQIKEKQMKVCIGRIYIFHMGYTHAILILY